MKEQDRIDNKAAGGESVSNRLLDHRAARKREAEYERLYDVLIAARIFIADDPQIHGAIVRQSYEELKSAVEQVV